jgi:circadian clock protein KaiB
MYRLRLYVTGSSSLSSRALANITALCDERLRGRYEIDVVDVLADPGRAASADVSMTPTLVKEAPGPVRWLLGDLGDRRRVLRTLGIGEHQRRPHKRGDAQRTRREAPVRGSNHDAVVAAARAAATAGARLTQPRQRPVDSPDPAEPDSRRPSQRNER